MKIGDKIIILRDGANGTGEKTGHLCTISDVDRHYIMVKPSFEYTKGKEGFSTWIMSMARLGTDWRPAEHGKYEYSPWLKAFDYQLDIRKYL